MDARSAALRVLLDFDNGKTERLGPALEAIAPQLDPRDAGLARELVFGVVRHRSLYDSLCRPFLRPGAQDPALLLALGMIAHQAFALDRIPPHAAVGETVEALRWLNYHHLCAVANAVGRKLLGLRLEQVRAGLPAPLGRIVPRAVPADEASRHNLPQALLNDLVPVLPANSTEREQRLSALNTVPHLCLRARPGASIGEHPAVVRREGSLSWWSDIDAALDVVRAGNAVVQDAAQAAAMALAAPQAGELALDLCAAPGGKSSYLHDAGCRVIAAELHSEKAKALAGLLPGRVLVADGRRPPFTPASFDLVVLDAPCSNSGVLARRPEARVRYTNGQLAGLAGLQRALLASAARLVRPGGRLLYSTCSLSPRENQQIAASLASSGWQIVREATHWPDGWQAGGYAAVLRQAGA